MTTEHEPTTRRAATFEAFRTQRTVVLTTFKRDGTPVPTPVNLAVDADPSRAFVRTWTAAGKAKRLRHTTYVEIAPSTFRGKVTGPSMRAIAHPVDGDEADRARRLVRRKHPILHGLLVPLGHRLRRLTTCYYELRPVDDRPS